MKIRASDNEAVNVENRSLCEAIISYKEVFLLKNNSMISQEAPSQRQGKHLTSEKLRSAFPQIFSQGLPQLPGAFEKVRFLIVKANMAAKSNYARQIAFQP